MKFPRSYRSAASLMLWLAAGGSAAAGAQSLEVSAEQMVRLGIELDRPAPVDVMTVATGPAEIVVPPARQAIASTAVGGLVVRLLVAEGDRVVAGAGIAEIESPDLLDWQREFLEAGIEAELATLQLERDRSLANDGIIAERRLEESRARDRAARTHMSQARQQLAIAGFDSAAIDSLAASGRLTSRLTLRAPIGGVVTARFVEPGMRVEATDPILSFADPSEIWVEMHLPAEKAIAVDAAMRIRIPLGVRAVLAPITVVGSVIDPETQTVLIRAELDDPDPRLRAGQFLAVEIVTGADGAEGYRLPASALVRQDNEPFVFVREAGAFRPVRIEPVHEDDRHVLIAGGIDADAEIAVRGTSTLKSLWLASLEGGSE